MAGDTAFGVDLIIVAPVVVGVVASVAACVDAEVAVVCGFSVGADGVVGFLVVSSEPSDETGVKTWTDARRRRTRTLMVFMVILAAVNPSDFFLRR